MLCFSLSLWSYLLWDVWCQSQARLVFSVWQMLVHACTGRYWDRSVVTVVPLPAVVLTMCMWWWCQFMTVAETYGTYAPAGTCHLHFCACMPRVTLLLTWNLRILQLIAWTWAWCFMMWKVLFLFYDAFLVSCSSFSFWKALERIFGGSFSPSLLLHLGLLAGLFLSP